MSKKATIRDVALEADCSPSLVSLYLRNPQSTRLAEGTKKRIARAVEKLDYRRNLLASILKSGSSNVIGVLADAQANPTIFRLIACLELEAAKRNMRLQLGLFHNSLENMLEACNVLKQYGASGIICLCHDYPDFNEELDRRFQMYPELVFYDGPLRHGHACVMPDKAFAVELACKELQKRGHKKIGLCIPGECPAWYSISQKEEAFREIVRQDELICRLPHHLPLRQAMNDVLLPFIRKQKPDALLLSSDRHAICAMNVLRQKGIRIPEDIAVIGFDNDPVCTELIPSLSSLALNQELIAQKLFDLVLAKNNRAEVIPLYPELILRESC